MRRRRLLPYLDRQLQEALASSEALDLPDQVRTHIASTVYGELAGLDELDEGVGNRLRASIAGPLEHVVKELIAFQACIDIARTDAGDPTIAQALLMTSVHAAFVWRPASLLVPMATAVSDTTTFAKIVRFLFSGSRRTLQLALTSGRWTYHPDFSGLECWTELLPGAYRRVEISNRDLDAWQLLNRGTAIAALLALVD